MTKKYHFKVHIKSRTQY